MDESQPLLRELGHFELRRLLGRGGFADVFLAYDRDHDREVALKVLPLTDDPESREMQQAEENGARIQRRLHPISPEVVEIYEFGELEGYFYIAMEHVEGEGLAKLLGDGPLPEERAVDVAWQLCKILERTRDYHAEIDGRKYQGIVHGDLKPGNIRLQTGDLVRVFDFGIAKHLSQSRRFTQSRGHSIAYASPERLERVILDEHSDLWSVAVMLYEMVCGRRPYRGRNDFELEKAIVDGTPEPLPEGSCTSGLRRIIYKALAFDPAQRYASAAELRAALGALRDGTDDAGEADGDGFDATREAAAGERTRRTPRLEDIPIDDPPVDDPAPVDARTSRTPPDAADLEDGRTRRTPTGTSETTLPLDDHVLATTSTPERHRDRRRLLRLAAVLLVGVFLLSQIVVYIGARKLRQQLRELAPGEVVGEIDVLWERYQSLDRYDVLGIPLTPARRSMRASLIASAERVISGFEVDRPRRDLPWGSAVRHFQNAIALGAKKPRIRTRLIYCQGHLDRIEAHKLGVRNKPDEARARRNDALVNFREAADREPEWYAPYLGIARIYAYDEFDLDRLETAIEKALELGYPGGKREIAQLADGHLRHCRDLHTQVAAESERSGRWNLLNDARRHCKKSIRLFSGIRDFASAKENMDSAQRTLKELDRQLRSLR